MAHFYEVLSDQYNRSNKDGSITRFSKGETVELEGPSDDDRLKPVPQGGKLPSAPGFLHKEANEAQKAVVSKANDSRGVTGPVGGAGVVPTSASGRASEPKFGKSKK